MENTTYLSGRMKHCIIFWGATRVYTHTSGYNCGERRARSPCLSFKEDSFPFAICLEMDILSTSSIGEGSLWGGRQEGPVLDSAMEWVHDHQIWSEAVPSMTEHFLTWSSEECPHAPHWSLFSLMRLRWLNLAFGLLFWEGPRWIILITLPYHICRKAKGKGQIKLEKEEIFLQDLTCSQTQYSLVTHESHAEQKYRSMQNTWNRSPREAADPGILHNSV